MSNSAVSTGCVPTCLRSTPSRTPLRLAAARPAVKSPLRRSASTVAGSAGSLAASAFISSAASATLRVIGPAVSWLWLIGTTWVRLIKPTVGLNPTIPPTEAGQVIDPSVSVPIAAHASPAAIAAPLPDEEPHGERSSAWGFFVCPPTALHPLDDDDERMFAHSERLVLPRITAPALRSRATSGASRPVTLSFRARLPAVVANGPVISILSFTSRILPASGPPTLRAAASSFAASGLIASTAFSIGPASSTCAIRAR